MKALLSHLLHRWILRVQTHPRPVLAAAAVLALFSLVLAATRLSVDTDPANMLSAELPWRQAERALEQAFPDSEPGLVLVIDAGTVEAAADTQAALAAALQGQVEHFKAVRAAELDPYFRRHGLLYLDLDALQDFADSLLRAQPFLGALAREPSLSGVANLLSRALEAPQQDFALAPALNAFADSVDAAARGESKPLAWSQLMASPGALTPGTRRFIELQPILDYGRLQPASEAVQAIRQAIADLPADTGTTVRLTGRLALEHEEIGMAFSGALLAFGVALVLATALLFIALRSGRLVGATVITLLFGLILTAGFAALAVGQLNLISMAFGVLYVGLGLDYALYLAMRYRELRQSGVGHRAAIPQAAGDVGGFLFVCAATTSLGFLAFVPTSFTGIAGLGLISGAGMFISLIASLSVLPALLALWPAIEAPPARPSPRLDALLELPYTRLRTIWIGMAVLLTGATLLAPKARFDFDPLHLRDPDSESVSTFRDLLRDPSIPTLTLSAVVADDDAARALSATLAQRPTVRRAMSVLDLVPSGQDEKLAVIDELNLSLGPALAGGGVGELKVLARPEDAASLDRLQDAMTRAAQLWKGDDAAAAKRLAQALSRLQQVPQPGERIDLLRGNLLAALPPQITQLRELLSAGPVTEADLPAWLRAKWRAADGRPRVEVWPKEVLDENAATARFVADVRAAAPAVTGGPVGMIEAGQAVVEAFRQAFLYSLVAISLLLIVLLRSLRDTALVLLPLIAAGLLTLAGSVLFDTPFNFANVIALPLLLGVGVDYGVYLVQQGRQLPADANLLKTGATRAVLFGALVTLANFGDLMLARHPGMVSMGLLLTVGLTMILLCTLVLLPGLIRRFHT